MNQRQEQFQQFGVIIGTMVFIFAVSSCERKAVLDNVIQEIQYEIKTLKESNDAKRNIRKDSKTIQTTL